MPVIKYKILETKKLSTDRDYFTTAGENYTTELDIVFPDAYSTKNGWSQYVVFQLINEITLADATVTKAPKFSIPNGIYIIPNTLINATITHIQFRSEKIIDTVVNVFETEKKIFPRTSTSIVGVLGSAETLPGVYVTQDTLAGSLSTFIVGGVGITATYNATTGKTTLNATGEALPGPHASSHATGGLDELTPSDIGAASADAVSIHNSDITDHTPYLGVTGGVANAYTVSSSLITGGVEGISFAIKIHADSTGSSTIDASSLGPVAIKRSNGMDTAVGTLKSGMIYTLRYNGVNYIIQGSGDLNYTSLNKDGDTATGVIVAQNNIAYTTKQVRNIILSPNDAVLSSMGNGDIWFKYA